MLGPKLNAYEAKCRALKKGDQYYSSWEGAPYVTKTLRVLKWKVLQNNAPAFPTPDQAASLCPSVPVDVDLLRTPPAAGAVRATWCGHASYFVELGSVRVLTDPVWSQRCSPSQYFGPKRFVQPPLKLAEFPGVDVVTVSHNHYDHLDHTTILELEELYKPRYVVPSGMKTWFADLGWKEEQLARVHELRWWECTVLDVPSGRLAVSGVPVQHWTRRGACDLNKQLWCGFVYETLVGGATTGGEGGGEGEVLRAFHSGDTGYCEAFKEIGAYFGRFDLAMIPIGAYEPRDFLHSSHVDPAQAVQIHLDLNRPKKSLGMHWGTFILTDEPVDEPPKLLAAEAAGAKLNEGDFIAPRHGQTVTVL
ncbi:hypothetical protein DIPPA_12397 [Diplonema papillatum]|nr:hypothetical protein DIPPA_12397 [Diplonema papillatum]